MTLLQGQQLHVRVGRQLLLRGVDVCVGAGQVLGVVGPNGAGKTTLLRTLLGLLTPVSGAVLLAGEALRQMPRRHVARQIAYLAQGHEVHWPLSVEALVGLGRLPHRRGWRSDARADTAAIEAALAETDLLALRARSMTTLSGGERMRAHLARALATQAAVLLADEPVAALDPGHQLQVMALLQRLARAGHAVVVVLHDLGLALRFCDRLLLLQDGAVRAAGEASAVLSDTHLAGAFAIRALRLQAAGHTVLVPWEGIDAHDHGALDASE